MPSLWYIVISYITTKSIMRQTHNEVKKINGKRVATPEYRSWQMMRNRCLNKNATDYSYYGGRGISIDPRWDQYENFLLDMGRRPSLSHSLERLDYNGNYVKSNCCWATRKEQARNRAYAKTKAWELAEKLGVKPMTAHHYIWRVRAKDRGVIKGTAINPECELIVRDFLKGITQ